MNTLAQTASLHPLPVQENISFIDLAAQQAQIRPQIDLAIQRVLDHGQYIMGPEIKELETQLAQYCGVKHVITCGSGTDALMLSLLALGVQPGDAILVPSFTFSATAEVVALLGAVPLFVDVTADTFNIDKESTQAALTKAQILGLKPVGIIPVDLFGQPADYSAIIPWAREHHLWVLADAAQSFGATYGDKTVGGLADITATSFFPAKPLGCYGDGGAVFTNNDELAYKVKSLRVHGQGRDKYENIRVGINGRLDTLQAAILLEKLRIFPQELKRRQEIATLYSNTFAPYVQVPYILPQATSAWAQYTLCLPREADRQAIMDELKHCGIPTMVYYKMPLDQQTAYRDFPRAVGEKLPISHHLSQCVFSLPMPVYNAQHVTVILGTVETVLKMSYNGK